MVQTSGAWVAPTPRSTHLYETNKKTNRKNPFINYF